MRVALYPRVSGHEQEDNYSIPEQIDRMRKYCEARDWTVYKIYTDSGFSGSNMDRPGLQSMIRDAKAGKFEMVLVYKLDRLSRSQKDTLYLIEDVFEKHNVGFSSMTENFDTSSPHGKFIIGILSVFSQLEREKIRERTMMGKKARAEEGKWGGGSKEPTGYDYTSGELVINEYEAMQIREAADLFLKDTPIRTIANMFNEKGYRHKCGDGLWDAKSIKRILVNPLYIGMMKHKDKYFQGTHTPIFDQETHDALVKKMDERKDKYGTQYKPHVSLLGGLLFCKQCGARYARQVANSGTSQYYCCYSRMKKVPKMIKDPNCQNKNYKMLDLDYVVIEAITQLSIDPNYINQVREEKPKNDAVEKRKIIEKEIDSIGSQISNLMDLYAVGNMPLDLINKKVSALNETRTSLEKELDSLVVFETANDEMTNEQIQELADLINNKDLTLNDRRAIVQSLIQYIEIDEENILIHWKF